MAVRWRPRSRSSRRWSARERRSNRGSAAARVMNATPLRFSFIVPFHRGLLPLARCLQALDARPPDSELIVAADGTGDDCGRLAAEHGAHVVPVAGPSGPAVKRNAAVPRAAGAVG